MTTSTHSQFNYNRRDSATASSPYTIPIKHQQHHQQHQQSSSFNNNNNGNINIPSNRPSIQQHNAGPISTSVPSLSREFVVRRISEGETGRLKEELKCEACGKGYKHISSLAKHLWEHTPEWNVTKKLLISKHQQVQLLEAASILVGMNELTSPSSNNESVFIDDEISQNSPFSPSNSADTNLTSNTPTPPMNPEDGSKLKNQISSNFKNSFDLNNSNNEIFESSTNNYIRSNSISQYPPSINDLRKQQHHQQQQQQQQQSNISGGYLDSPVIISNSTGNNLTLNNKQRSNSIFQHQENDEEDDEDEENEGFELKSPPPSYQTIGSHLLPNNDNNLSNISPINSNAIQSPVNNNKNQVNNDDNSDDSLEESVIGKME